MRANPATNTQVSDIRVYKITKSLQLRPDPLRFLAYARLASMPVIEQAKGILMAQCGWSEDQAFNALRRPSQRKNIKLRDLAAKVVATTAQTASAQSRSRDRRQSGVAAQDRARRA